ncbi:MAG: prepilin-type N-terminal cleavage/methylation domain-containing protein [Elusimicrobiaceae bacterium]|nr:prepilin-type N-terminal cleavage/methylation domain-containing protein [Elusimicrobiaceae bacterium]
MYQNKAFTLIELLVVVLIIGILAAVALPQYRVAVQKARLARLIPLVDAVYKSEESYYLANGNYTTDLSVLDIDVTGPGCTLETSSTTGWYMCGDYDIGVADGPVNAQVHMRDANGNLLLSYLYYFNDSKTNTISKGAIRCFSNGELNRKVCLSLGAGTEQISGKGETWEYRYTLAN